MIRTAFLVDGSFFLKRHRALCGEMSEKDTAKSLHAMCCKHLYSKPRTGERAKRRAELYRIFYYDCPPLSKKAHHPITGQAIDFSRSSVALWRLEFFEELKKLRKVALRMGYLSENAAYWAPHPNVFKQLLQHHRSIDDLEEADVRYECRQKGVDMRIGLDISSLSYKKLVDQIILVSGDSDFVPAAKLARREGIDFVLDPMWAPIRADLHEHIDGLRSVIGNKKFGQNIDMELE